MEENPSYAQKWAGLVKNRQADSQEWQRTQSQRRHPDRVWLHKHVKGLVLDVGCGTGLDAKAFRVYVGADVTLPFLKAAHFRHKVANVVRCDGRYLPFRDKVFPTAFSKGLLLHYPQREGVKIIYELLRVSKTTYISWGALGGINYTPSNRPIIKKSPKGFFYNRYDLNELEKHFKIIPIKEGISITLVKDVNKT